LLEVLFGVKKLIIKNKDMEIHCPACGCEDAYHNGVCYECPECNHEWVDEWVDEWEDEPEEWDDDFGDCENQE
jgi:uncharacterized Zn ribbon protein